MMIERLHYLLMAFLGVVMLSFEAICSGDDNPVALNYLWIEEYLIPLPPSYVIASIQVEEVAYEFTYTKIILVPLAVNDKNSMQLKYVNESNDVKVNWEATRTLGNPSYISTMQIAGEDVLCVKYSGKSTVTKVIYGVNDYEVTITGPDARKLMKKVLSNRKPVEALGRIEN